MSEKNRKIVSKKTIKMYFMVIIILAVVFILGIKYERYKQIKIVMRSYVNRMSGEINQCNNLLYDLNNWNDSKDKNNIPVQYTIFIENIKEIQGLNDYAQLCTSRYKDSDIFYQIRDSFWAIDTVINSGVNSTNGVMNDGVISDNEKQFLLSLYSDLQVIENKLYNRELRQENSISLKELKEIMKSFIEKYPPYTLEGIEIKN